MTTQHPDRPFSRRTALAGLGAGGLGLALAPRNLAGSAQVGTPRATHLPRSGHALIGTWQITNDPDTHLYPYITFATFTDDGTYVETGTNRYVGIGTWRATGEATAEFGYLVLEPLPLDAIFEPGYVVSRDLWSPGNLALFRGEIEIDPTGDVLGWTGLFEFQDTSGAATGTHPSTGRGDRMTVDTDPAASPTA